MRFNKFLLLALPAMALASCKSKSGGSSAQDSTAADTAGKGTFAYDLKFLQSKDSVVVLKNEAGTSQIIVSPKYQAKVFTSTADGDKGHSFGWVNYKEFDLKTPDP